MTARLTINSEHVRVLARAEFTEVAAGVDSAAGCRKPAVTVSQDTHCS